MNVSGERTFQTEVIAYIKDPETGEATTVRGPVPAKQKQKQTNKQKDPEAEAYLTSAKSGKEASVCAWS